MINEKVYFVCRSQPDFRRRLARYPGQPASAPPRVFVGDCRGLALSQELHLSAGPARRQMLIKGPERWTLNLLQAAQIQPSTLKRLHAGWDGTKLEPLPGTMVAMK